MKSLATALNVSAETLLRQAGLIDAPSTAADLPDTEAAIASDPRLTQDQRTALLAVYRSYLEQNG